MQLQDRDQDLLRALSVDVRLATPDQLRRGWGWPDTESGLRNCRKRLGGLADAGLLYAMTVPSTPMLCLTEPVFRWYPGDGEPDFDAVSYALQSRWRGLEERPTRVYTATFQAASIFGGRGRTKYTKLTQATHDLHVTELYLLLRENEPETADTWVGEDLIAIDQRKFEKLADAELRENGRTSMYLEFGGRYGAREVRKKHEFFSGGPLYPGAPLRQPVPYEIW